MKVAKEDLPQIVDTYMKFEDADKAGTSGEAAGK